MIPMLNTSDMTRARERLVGHLRKKNYLTTDPVIQAMLEVPREEFIPRELRGSAYDDRPLPIGRGQTISAPHMVAIMTELLAIDGGERMLEIGGGSGYHVAVVGTVLGIMEESGGDGMTEVNGARGQNRRGHIFSIEFDERLAAGARATLDRLGMNRVTLSHGDGGAGLPEEAPFDRIWAACACPSVPDPWKEQLADGGRLIVPLDAGWAQELIMVTRSGDEFEQRRLMGVTFVPLRGVHGK